MLDNLLNMEGVAVLSKQQQSAVQGGLLSESCRITIYHDNGAGETANVLVSGSSGQEISDSANNICVDQIADGNNHVARCTYDCGYDGYGQ